MKYNICMSLPSRIELRRGFLWKICKSTAISCRSRRTATTSRWVAGSRRPASRITLAIYVGSTWKPSSICRNASAIWSNLLNSARWRSIDYWHLRKVIRSSEPTNHLTSILDKLGDTPVSSLKPNNLPIPKWYQRNWTAFNTFLWDENVESQSI